MVLNEYGVDSNLQIFDARINIERKVYYAGRYKSRLHNFRQKPKYGGAFGVDLGGTWNGHLATLRL